MAHDQLVYVSKVRCTQGATATAKWELGFSVYSLLRFSVYGLFARTFLTSLVQVQAVPLRNSARSRCRA